MPPHSIGSPNRTYSMTTVLRDFLEIPYDQLEEMNLKAKAQRLARTPLHEIQEERMKYLADEKRIKVVCTCSITIRNSC
jgi:glutamine synthetase